MRSRCVVILLVGTMCVLIPAALILPAISRVREAANRILCASNMRTLLASVQTYEVQHQRFPRAAIANDGLPPEKRLSWLVEVFPYMVAGKLPDLDKTKAWDSDENLDVKVRLTKVNRTEPSDWGVYRCPSVEGWAENGVPFPSHFVGVAGIGADAPMLDAKSPHAGVFGYDRQVRMEDIKDGQSYTILLAETVTENGMWTAGGHATCRGLVPDRPPYLGSDGQFNCRHKVNSDFLFVTYPHATNVGFIDGTIRYFTDSMDPDVFEAMATIAGGEAIQDTDLD